jgi:hypothetical protein
MDPPVGLGIIGDQEGTSLPILRQKQDAGASRLMSVSRNSQGDDVDGGNFPRRGVETRQTIPSRAKPKDTKKRGRSSARSSCLSADELTGLSIATASLEHKRTKVAD